MSGAAPRLALAVVGAGLIGRRHVGHVLASAEARLCAVVDPAPAARDLAAKSKSAWYPDLPAMLRACRPDGVIVATPNRLHVENGRACVAAGIPALIEKPLADDVVAATGLVEAAERAGVPLLTGHHRRYNPLIAEAKAAISAGQIGAIVAVHGICWFHKPASYFEVAWRREAGAGPVFINLIHDVDLLRHLCGEVVAVQAMCSHATRGHKAEDTAVILLRFAGGALGTLTLSDTIAAPWSWEFTSGENPAYSHTGETCYQIGGTRGALALPQLDLWRHDAAPDWWTPIAAERLPASALDPLARQIAHFCEVIRGEAAPLVSGREGLNSLKVIAAIAEAAGTGRTVTLD